MQTTTKIAKTVAEQVTDWLDGHPTHTAIDELVAEVTADALGGALPHDLFEIIMNSGLQHQSIQAEPSDSLLAILYNLVFWAVFNTARTLVFARD